MDEQLIKEITALVVRILEKNDTSAVRSECPGKILVIGPMTLWAEKICKDFQICFACESDIDDNIEEYKKIIITRLSLTDLSDIASVREGSVISRCVLHGLLAGIPVIMDENALERYKYKGTGSRRLYKEIEKKADLIRAYGVQDAADNKCCGRKENELFQWCTQPETVMCAKKLITEQDAEKIADQTDGMLYVEQGTILTPLAKDLFRNRKVEVIYKEKKEQKNADL